SDSKLTLSTMELNDNVLSRCREKNSVQVSFTTSSLYGIFTLQGIKDYISWYSDTLECLKYTYRAKEVLSFRPINSIPSTLIDPIVDNSGHFLLVRLRFVMLRN